MAKLALINRELKRKACAQKFAAKRAALKAVINDATRSMEERMEARNALQMNSYEWKTVSDSGRRRHTKWQRRKFHRL